MCDVDRSKLQVSRRLIDGFDGILDASFENGDPFDDTEQEKTPTERKQIRMCPNEAQNGIRG